MGVLFSGAQLQSGNNESNDEQERGAVSISAHTALVGNPNCGKTTMFNDLTGANQYVGNWPGITDLGL